MTQWTRLAAVDELKPGDRKTEFIDDNPVLLVRTDDDYFCVADVCSHDGQPLGDGPISDNQITCTRHGARFDLANGNALCMPATEPIVAYTVEVTDDGVLARLATSDDSDSQSNAIPTDDRTDDRTDDETSVSDPDASPADNSTATPSPPETTPSSESDDASADLDPTAGESGTVDAAAMLEALKEVIDPELMVNIVDLGLIYDVRHDGDDSVAVDMTLTSPACPAGPQLVQQSKMALERLDGVTEAQINLVMTPPWTPERMTDDARDKLGIF